MLYLPVHWDGLQFKQKSYMFVVLSEDSRLLEFVFMWRPDSLLQLTSRNRSFYFFMEILGLNRIEQYITLIF